MENSSLNAIVETTLEKIKGLVDVNTIIGQPIRADERTTIVPVSKVTFGFASGGSEFGGKTAEAKHNFGGGSGAGVTIAPIAFLIVQGDNIKVTPVVSGSEPVDKIASIVPEIFDKVTALFRKNKNPQKEDGSPASAENAE